MPVQVFLYSTLRKYQKDGSDSGSFQIAYTPGMTIESILDHLGITGNQEVSLVAVNGELKGQDSTVDLKDGDQVALYGVIDGG